MTPVEVFTVYRPSPAISTVVCAQVGGVSVGAHNLTVVGTSGASRAPGVSFDNGSIV